MVPYLTSDLGGGARAELHEAQNLALGWLLARQLPHTMLLDGDEGCNTINTYNLFHYNNKFDRIMNVNVKIVKSEL